MAAGTGLLDNNPNGTPKLLARKKILSLGNRSLKHYTCWQN